MGSTQSTPNRSRWSLVVPSAPPRDSLERVGDVVSRADARAQLLLAELDTLADSRAVVQRLALEAESRACDHVDQIAQHRRALAAVLQQERKAVCVHVGDVAALAKLLRAAFEALGGCPDAHPLGNELLYVLRACDGALRVPRAPRFAFAQTRLDALPLRQMCRVEAVRETSWAVHAARPAPIAPMFAPRANHGVAVLPHTGTAFVIGGSDTSSCEQYNLRDNSWSVLAETTPGMRRSCGACVIGNLVVVLLLGGNGEDGTSVQAYDTVGRAWIALPSIPGQGFARSVAGYGSHVYVSGGYWKGASSPEVWSLDVTCALQQLGDQQRPAGRLAAWTQVASMPTGRHLHGGAVGSSHLFVCGGLNKYAHLDSCDAFSFKTSKWVSVPSLPVRLRECGCCFAGGNLFVVGGYTGFQPSSKAFALPWAVAQQGWLALPEMGSPRGGCGVVSLGKQVLVFGGYDGTRFMNSCERFAFGF